MLEPWACNAGTRQLFTNAPSKRTEHEPHSHSPEPSFVPVSWSSWRSTSSSRSIGWTCKVVARPLTVNDSSHFAPRCEESLIDLLAPDEACYPAKCFHAVREKCLPTAAVQN